MKKSFLPVIGLLLLFRFSSFGQTQAEVLESPCDNQTIQKQADSVKLLLSTGGFSILREASITMESNYDIPIIVPMEEGTRYQFVFIGDLNSNTYEVRMYDYHEKQVIYQKHARDDREENIIRYSYVPRTSEYHMIKPLQVNAQKKKDLCGYVMLFSQPAASTQKTR